MREPTFLFILAIAISLYPTALGEDYISISGGPQLAASSVDMRMISDSTDDIRIILRNEGNITFSGENSDQMAAIERDFEQNGSRAIGIRAELVSKDDRIKILSGPQVVGSLDPGESRPVEFTATASEGLGAGIYPFDLLLAYTRQANVEVMGILGFPDLYFSYVNESYRVPIEVVVVDGPKIIILGADGAASPGVESEIELRLQNVGGSPAGDVLVQAIAQSPFIVFNEPASLGDLAQGQSASALLKLSVKNATEAGEYPLPLNVSYIAAGHRRNVELAVMARANEGTLLGLKSLILPIAILAIVVLMALACLVARSRLAARGKRRRRAKL